MESAVNGSLSVSSETGSPRLMPLNNLVKARLKRIQVEAAMPVHRDRFVVKREFRILRGMKPDATLLYGQGNGDVRGPGRYGFLLLSGSKSGHSLLKEQALCLGEALFPCFLIRVLNLFRCHC